MKEFKKFEEKIGVDFKNKELLKQAFTHRSYINENPGNTTIHNERLEFLGDAVLELVVTDFLYKKYEDRTEGELTSFRSALVNSITIAEAGGNADMNDFLLLSKGEAKDNGKARQYILANTYEAVIGAIYLDQGYEKAEDFIANTLLHKTEEMVEKGLWRDSKSLVQEKAQEIISVTPSYKVLSESGPDHDKSFTIGIYFGEELVAQGKGKSKQESQQKAAEAALLAKGWVK